MIICIDAGHGLGNRKRGRYDPGAIGVEGAQEARWATAYARCLESKFFDLGIHTILTRRDESTPCPLRWRPELARQSLSDLLVSIHFNADAKPGVSASDGRVKGFEVLYRTSASKRFARVIAERFAIAGRKVRGVWFRNNLYVLRYTPSVLVEFGFIDDPEDFALIRDPQWMSDACTSVAEAVDSILDG